MQDFKKKGHAQVSGYKRFGYLKETETAAYISREAGKDTRVPFEKMLIGIEAYQHNPENYDMGPSVLRQYGLTHVTSPIFALLHLLPKKSYLQKW